MRIILLLSFSLLMTICCKTQQSTTTDLPKETSKSEDKVRDKKPGQRGGPPSIDEVFKMDINGDGMLSLEEVKETPISRRFSEIDMNEDGLISREEFEKAPKPDKKRPPRRPQ